MNFVAAVEILVAMVHQEVDKNTPCVSEYTNVMKCMRSKSNDICFSCILDSVADIHDNVTFPELVESNICSELARCASEKCDPGCSEEWITLYSCAEIWAEEYAEDVQVCEQLDEAVSAKRQRPILVQDFNLPFNYTNAGLEALPSH